MHRQALSQSNTCTELCTLHCLAQRRGSLNYSKITQPQAFLPGSAPLRYSGSVCPLSAGHSHSRPSFLVKYPSHLPGTPKPAPIFTRKISLDPCSALVGKAVPSSWSRPASIAQFSVPPKWHPQAQSQPLPLPSSGSAVCFCPGAHRVQAPQARRTVQEHPAQG